MQLLTRCNGTPRTDVDASTALLSLAVAITTVVDPARRIPAHRCVDDTLCIDVKEKSVVRVGCIMRVALQGLLPVNHLTHILNQCFASGNVAQRKHTFAVNARASDLEPPGAGGSRSQWFFRHK